MTTESIKVEIVKMNRLQIVEMIHYLIDHIAKQDLELELTEEVKAELDRREASIKDGTAKLFTWEEVKTNIQQMKAAPAVS